MQGDASGSWAGAERPAGLARVSVEEVEESGMEG